MLSHRSSRSRYGQSTSTLGWLEKDASASDTSDMGDEFVQDAQQFAREFDSLNQSLNLSKKSVAEKQDEVFGLVEGYYAYAAKKVQTLRGSHRRPPRSSLRRLDDASSQDSMDLDDGDNAEESPDAKANLEYWEQEAQTWDLLCRLLPLRYGSQDTLKPGGRGMFRFEDISETWEEFFNSDLTVQERKAILDCLQTSADHSRVGIDELVREYQQRAERGDIIAHGWLHTRSTIKMQKNVNGWAGVLDPNTSDAGQLLVDNNGTEPLVTQLDPDVALRQGRKLQPPDEYFERAIWLGCYELLRRGRSISEIKEWCKERTEVWRAVSMSALCFSTDGDQGGNMISPLSQLLWRRTCFALARQGGTDDYERAVYGILSGDISSVEKVCQGWDDHVFVHYNALLRSQFDAFLMKRSPPEATSAITQSLPSFNAVQFHGDATSVGERLVQSLESNPKTAAEAKTPIKSLQAAIISNKLDQYIYELGLVLGDQANSEESSALIPKFDAAKAVLDTDKFFQLNNYRGLRVLVHIYLVITTLDELEGGARNEFTERHQAQENVLAAYVSALRLNNMIDLLPLYCSKLHGDRAFFTLGRNLSSVPDPSDRETLLRLMEKLGMDIAAFVLFQPDSLLRQHPVTDEPEAPKSFTVFSNEPPTLKYGRPLKPDFFGEVPEQLDPVDEQLIQSLEWFLLVEDLWNEIFAVGTTIYKRFLKRFNLHAARALSERVPCSEIFRRKAKLGEFPMPEDDTDISWFAEIRAAAENGALEGISPDEVMAARNYFEMECLVRTLDSMETVASSEGLAKDPTEELDRNFWAEVGAEVKRTKSLVRPLLGNWLTESLYEDVDFADLRDAYLPETIIGYVSVLHFAGTSLSRDNLLECMELASVIAKKDSDVAAVLVKSGRMKEIVEGFANCSKALAIGGSEKKSSGGSSKKLRELGWTRELWSIKR